jgi:hypothetical protein
MIYSIILSNNIFTIAQYRIYLDIIIDSTSEHGHITRKTASIEQNTGEVRQH